MGRRTSTRRIVGHGLMFVAALTACSGNRVTPVDSSVPSLPLSSSSPSTSATPEAVDFCTFLPVAGATLKKVQKGTELPDELATELSSHQATLEATADNSTGKVAKALRRAADAEGQLNVAIAAAGANYTTDPTVDLRRRSASITLLSAALVSGCGL